MFKNTSIHISECPDNSTNLCGYCEMNGDVTKADFISEIRYFYKDELFLGPHHSHESVCKMHIVALIENFRDIER
jgi:hypothetical protein